MLIHFTEGEPIDVKPWSSLDCVIVLYHRPLVRSSIAKLIRKGAFVLDIVNGVPVIRQVERVEEV